MVGVAGGVGLGDEPTERAAIDDGFVDAERLAEPLHVVAPLVEFQSRGRRRCCDRCRVDRSRRSGRCRPRRRTPACTSCGRNPARHAGGRVSVSLSCAGRQVSARTFHVEIEPRAVDLGQHGMPAVLPLPLRQTVYRCASCSAITTPAAPRPLCAASGAGGGGRARRCRPYGQAPGRRLP